MAEEFGVKLLAQLHLAGIVRAQSDRGIPIIIAEPESDIAKPYWEMALQVAASLSCRPVDYTAAILQIVVETS